jgi:hypothetical protein
LYLINGKFICRVCANLTYESSKRHDKRVDLLANLSEKEFLEGLQRADPKRAQLYFRAWKLRAHSLHEFRNSSSPKRTVALH